MKIDELGSYQDVIQSLYKKNRRKHLLFGNGFSISFDSNIFSYNALSSFINRTKNDLLIKLFTVIKTKNFELIMQQLENFLEIAKAFSTDRILIEKLSDAGETLKRNLIQAVQELHPEHVFKVPEEKCISCFNFLNEYLTKGGYVFSTNYDLLPYWVVMRNKTNFAVDGFGRELENPEEVKRGQEPEFSELRWGKHKDEQTIFYLHGALPIFDTGIDIIKEVYDSEHYLLQNISERMEKKEYPVFVTAGSAFEKLNHIMHNKYLSFCYDKLCALEGSLVTFGFNFGEYDAHIIDAINKASTFHEGRDGKLYSIYVGVFSEKDLEHILSIKDRFLCKVNIYDARTAAIWG